MTLTTSRTVFVAHRNPAPGVPGIILVAATAELAMHMAEREDPDLDWLSVPGASREFWIARVPILTGNTSWTVSEETVFASEPAG